MSKEGWSALSFLLATLCAVLGALPTKMGLPSSSISPVLITKNTDPHFPELSPGTIAKAEGQMDSQLGGAFNGLGECLGVMVV